MTLHDFYRPQGSLETFGDISGEFAAYRAGSMAQAERVLLAEADSISTQLLSFTLQREGFEVIEARGGVDALRLARERAIDIVVAEVLLPDLDGYELCRQLRARWSTQRIPILLVTSLSGTDYRIEGLEAGADDFLVKPYDVRELLLKLHRLISIYSSCLQLHPLTRLPGSQIIESFIQQNCITPGRKWALLHIEPHYFSAYNQIYGYEAGNDALRMTADLLRDVVSALPEELALAAHDSADDFLAVVPLEMVDSVCRQLISRFDEEAPNLYPTEHRDSKYQVLIDRQRNTHLVPRLALSIGVVTSDLCEAMSYLEMREAATAVVTHAKTQEASSVFINRRHLVGRKA